ncbi:4-phosphoerythronate dehydrogenase [Thiomicrorhabdus cannonii]|uniref:4-phosphoerythronate dehydrogenase n=1 Tax=Thiomicrorhabdus cannonii TaxID=2748011 RepID=UPI0015BCCEBD|nr:4-phosphoerythronate dehydrogenase [Thiomicrorhabdus cannonii]
MSRHIIIDDAVPYAEAMFSHLGKVTLMPGRDISRQHLMDADALVVRSRTQVNAELLNGTPVKFVGSTVVGLDHIDQPYLHNNGIHFYSAQGCNANSVAEYIMTCLLDLAEHKGFELTEKTLGIIGVGHVGSLVYDKAQKLGIRCLLNDPPRAEAHPQQAEQFVDLDTCLQADMITFHTPLTHDGKHPTHHLLNKTRLASIRPDQVIINAARGGIIDESAWQNTPTLANVIDCWENEPHIDEALYQSAYLATPHIAGHSLDAKIAGGSMVYTQLCQFWKITPQETWHTQLPARPPAITLNTEGSLQQQLYTTLKTVYDPRNDDLAIRRKNIEDTYKNYEEYRRNYPIHREWHQHRFIPGKNTALNNLLISLGFHAHKA